MPCILVSKMPHKVVFSLFCKTVCSHRAVVVKGTRDIHHGVWLHYSYCKHAASIYGMFLLTKRISKQMEINY